MIEMIGMVIGVVFAGMAYAYRGDGVEAVAFGVIGVALVVFCVWRKVSHRQQGGGE